MRKNSKNIIVPVERIEHSILLIRGQKVILDENLAYLYGVETKVLNQAIRRNPDRFPKDFVFQLTQEEVENLRSQIVTSKGRGGRRYLPYVFTEHGALMAASVLSSPRAVAMSLAVIRTFVKLRNLLSSHKDLARKLEELEKKYDKQFQIVFQAIRELMEPSAEPEKPQIGFKAGN